MGTLTGYLHPSVIEQQEKTFFPVEDTPVKVEIEATDQILLNMPTYQECESQPNLSSVMDCIKAVNWRQIHSFNLTSIVKCKFAFVVV